MSRWHARARVGGRRWMAVRDAVLRRDGYRCKVCGRAGRLQVDHIRPLSKNGDPYDPENLQAICRGCHAAKTDGERPRAPRQLSPAEQKWRDYLNSPLEVNAI